MGFSEANQSGYGIRIVNMGKYIVFGLGILFVFGLVGLVMLASLFAVAAMGNQSDEDLVRYRRKLKIGIWGATLCAFVFLPLLGLVMLKYPQHYSSWYLLIPLFINGFFVKRVLS